jgi:hypothetical protein
MAARNSIAASCPSQVQLDRRNKKPTAGRPGIGAQFVSFNFLNRLIRTFSQAR